MFLTKILDNVRARALLALAGLAMIVGAGAAVSSVASVTQNEAVETKAGSGYYLHVWDADDCDGDYELTDNGNNEFKILNFYLPSGSHFLLHVGDTWFKGNYLDGGSGSGNFTANPGDNMACSGEGYYDIYAKNPNGNWYVNYWINTSSGYLVTRKYSQGGVDQGADELPRELVASGGSIAAPQSNCGYGYSFDGWYTAASGGTKVTSVTSSQTVYAHWISATMKTLYFDGGSLGSSTYSAPKAHVFDAYGERESWPGTAMAKRDNSKKSIYGGFVWSVSVPANGTVIFNPGGLTPDTGKTVDLDVTSVADGSTYLISKLGVGHWYTSVTLSLVNQDTSTTTNYFIYKDGSNGIGFTMPSLSKSGYIASWNSSSTGNGDDYAQNEFYSDGFTAATTTLYSKFIPASYTITFCQNDGSEHYVEDSKTYQEDYEIPAPGEGALSDMGASGGRYFIRWDTDPHGEDGTSYDPGDIYDTDADLTLHMIQGFYTYEFSLDDGDHWTTMVDADEVPSGYDKQYVNASVMTMIQGQEIIFRRYHDDSAHASFGSINSWTGNYNTTDGIVASCTGQIYLKIARDGTHDVWVSGITQRWVEVAGHRYSADVNYENTSATTENPVPIHPGDTIRAGYGDDSYALEYLVSGSDGVFSVVNGNMTSSCVGAFYVRIQKSTETADWPDVHFEMDAEGSAAVYAGYFNSQVGAICTGIQGGTKALSNLQSVWGATAASGQNYLYAHLTSGAKAYLNRENEDEDVVDFIEKYNYCLWKYGTTALPNFLGLSVTPPANAAWNPTPPLYETSPLTTTLWIVLASGVAGLAAIGTAYFVSKKKKQHQA